MTQRDSCFFDFTQKMVMRNAIIIILLTKVIFAFSQTQHMNQLIEDVLPDFITNYNKTHHMDFVLIENEMPYKATRTLPIKTKKFIEGKINGGLKNGYYCTGPSTFLVSKDTLRMQFFLCGTNKKIPGLAIGDTKVFYFVYQEQIGKWIYSSNFSSHATWYREGKFIGDFVKECMEECFMEVEKSNGIARSNIYVINDYCLSLFEIENPILPVLPHIPEGQNKKKYCKSDDWLVGFPEITFCNDTIAVSSKAFKAKDYKNDSRINDYMQCTFYYLYNTETQLWELSKKQIDHIAERADRREH